MFRVVPDQLRISEGWVRCGHCDEVFDANAHLRSLDEPAQVNSPVTQVGEGNVAKPVPTSIAGVQTPVDVVYDWGPLLEPHAAQVERAAVIAPRDAVQSLSQEEREPSWDLPLTGDAQQVPTKLDEAGAFLHQPPSDLPVSAESQYSPTISDDWVYQPLEPQETDPDIASNSKEGAAPSFMPHGPQQTWADRYLGHKVMLLVLFVLALLLTSQVLFLERDRIAANTPALHPHLVYGCEILGCTISAPRQIESIAIDSSAFTHVRSGVYRLSLSLRNGAAIDLATPALELTLTDMQDQTLVRRVLLPSEYSVPPLIGSRAELIANVPVSVRAGVASEKISGYKLLAFYP